MSELLQLKLHVLITYKRATIQDSMYKAGVYRNKEEVRKFVVAAYLIHTMAVVEALIPSTRQ